MGLNKVIGDVFNLLLIFDMWFVYVYFDIWVSGFGLDVFVLKNKCGYVIKWVFDNMNEFDVYFKFFFYFINGLCFK